MKKIVALAFALSASAQVVTANAAVQCGPRDRITEALNRQFQENRSAIGLSGEAAVFELFISTEGTWTMISTNVRGLTCVIAAGEAWQADLKRIQGITS